MARSNQTADWANRLSPSIAEIESLAIDAYAHLPENFRSLCGEITMQVSDFPDDQIIEDMGLESPFDLMGLFEGNGIGERFSLQTGDQVNRITLYRRGILDYWAEYEEALGDIVTHVLIHEIGHHFGLSDEEMERIEASVE
ncbi:metallopeptidase family protein [Phyllobacterium sp. CCNWLW109]|uniref:metallopeptidase family protein n=1 Tax=unclassified Phyllobacterium TaxID=2638441 RepID=UPI003076B8A3